MSLNELRLISDNCIKTNQLTFFISVKTTIQSVTSGSTTKGGSALKLYSKDVTYVDSTDKSETDGQLKHLVLERPTIVLECFTFSHVTGSK